MKHNISTLHNAKKAKNDEFYTQLIDIENELKHYTHHFKGKVVYCNCDGYDSNFPKYFIEHFNEFGLNKLISTGLNGYYQEYDGNKLIQSMLNGDGDFRSQECVDILKQSDIVVTNPPFSLFIDYVKQLIEYDKKFLIIGNMNAIIYKDIFPIIKANKMWCGYKFNGKPMKFRVPEDYEINGKVIDYDENGNILVGVGGTAWFTNLDNDKRNEKLELTCKYNEQEYPKYDNFDSINVNKVKNIPYDYDGLMRCSHYIFRKT